MERIEDLRCIWKHEAKDFSAWLAEDENLAMLGDAIGIEIQLEERESSVGKFSVDLYAKEVETGRVIIIENQLEETNHDHLGKIITYASGKDAKVVVWVVKRAREEHKQAIEWLNQHTDDDLGFFLLEIEVWKIGDSLPAPRFNVVEQPNGWAKTMKKISGESPLKQRLFEFWSYFADHAFEKPCMSAFRRRTPQPQHWYDMSLGLHGVVLQLTATSQKRVVTAGIYIKGNKELFHRYKAHAAEIEQKLGAKVEWVEAAKDCRFYISKPGDFSQNEAIWGDLCNWLSEQAPKLREIAYTYAS